MYKLLLTSLVFSLLYFTGAAQEMARQTLSTGGGSSYTISGGDLSIIWSVGQKGIIGSSSSSQFYLNQGYIQPYLLPVQTSDASDLDLQVYPNPFRKEFMIVFPDQSRFAIQIYDLMGRIVHEETVEGIFQYSIDLRNSASGTYVLKVISGNRYFSARIQKI